MLGAGSACRVSPAREAILMASARVPPTRSPRAYILQSTRCAVAAQLGEGHGPASGCDEILSAWPYRSVYFDCELAVRVRVASVPSGTNKHYGVGMGIGVGGAGGPWAWAVDASRPIGPPWRTRIFAAIVSGCVYRATWLGSTSSTVACPLSPAATKSVALHTERGLYLPKHAPNSGH